MFPDWFARHVDPTADGCWLWIGPRLPRGYGMTRRPGSRRKEYAHRLAVELQAGSPLAPGTIVMHKCDRPPCVRPSHLLIGSQSDNMLDMSRKGRNPAQRPGAREGEKNGRARLTWEDVAAIRASALPVRELVAKYGIERSSIYRIKQGRRWRLQEVSP